VNNYERGWRENSET